MKRLSRLRRLEQHLAPRKHMGSLLEPPPFDPNYWGAVLNILCDTMGCDRLEGLSHVLRQCWPQMHAGLVDYTVSRFREWVDEGGEKDLGLWLPAAWAEDQSAPERAGAAP